MMAWVAWSCYGVGVGRIKERLERIGLVLGRKVRLEGKPLLHVCVCVWNGGGPSIVS